MLKSVLSKEEFLDVDVLSLRIKSLSITVEKSATIDDAISTTGGVDLDFVDENYQLKKIENTYVIGEMLDWNGPTGGYLLQACFSMGHKLAKNLSQT